MALQNGMDAGLFSTLPAGSYVIEIGSERLRETYPGGSTKFLSDAANANGLGFRTVDFAQEAYEVCVDRLGTERAVLSDGEAFLKSFDAPISFLYLDNADIMHSPSHHEKFIEHWRPRYEKKGLSLKDAREVNERSALLHFNQALAALPKMTDVCYVGLDDTVYDKAERRWWGKGALALPLLLACGFAIETEANKGVLLSRGFKDGPSVFAPRGGQ